MSQCAHIYRDTPKAREAGKVGKQCGLYSINDTPFCKFHGGRTPSVITKYRAERYVEEQKQHDPSFTDLWPETHERLDPFSLLLWDIRRSGARIEWFDRQLDKITEEKSIWWGMTKKEAIGAAEFAGTNKTYEARENILVKMQNDERKRLKDLRDEWQNNKFEALKIAGYGAFREAMRKALVAVCAEFEIDMADPEIQARLRLALEGLPDPLPAIEAPDHIERRR